MQEKQTNQPLHESTKKNTDKLPEELRTNYNSSTHKGSGIVECLKVAAVLKLWFDRGYREIGFGVPSDVGGKTFYVDVLARDVGGMVGVECVSGFNLGRVRRRVAQLRCCLPPHSYLVAIFPSNIEDGQVDRVVELVDEVWVTGEDGRVARMMFASVFHKG